VPAFSQQRAGADRRRQPRGGRRAEDKPGFAPLVLVAAENADSRNVCETILARLRFAVAPVDSIERAKTVLSTLRPDVIIVYAHDPGSVPRSGWPSDVPFLALGDNVRDPDALVDAIRSAIRSRAV